jgi:hypothetical protein
MDAIQQFRITGWPGVLPRPPIHNSLSWALSEDGVLAPPDLGGLLMLHDVPDLEIVPLLRAQPDRSEFDRGDAGDVSTIGETYLELVNLDLADEQAILRFVRRFGVLGVAHEHFSLFRSLPGLTAAVLPTLAAAWPTERFNQTAQAYLDSRGDGPSATLVETLEEFRFGARVLRDLVTATRISNHDQPLETIRWESVPEQAMSDYRANLADYGVTLDPQGEATELFLRSLLTDGLRPFQPRVIYAEQEPVDELTDAPLYAICCLELFNHLIENAHVKVCANENCRRRFVRQRGRAEQGQHRIRGVKFCSNHCARAQAQREYRRRRRHTPPADHPPEVDA